MKKVFVPDDIDLKILSILMVDAKKTYAEIGKELFISGGTVHVRIKKLMDANVILNSQLKVDYSKLGYDITAFLGMYLEKSKYYDSVSQQLGEIPEILEAHYTTGTYSIFAKVICRDTDHLRDIISHQIQQINGIQRTETFISLHNSYERPLKITLSSDS
ncbi:MAG: winged helix-turn-helix transcriptional regulator [Saprospiraceae bacterium]|nr:Lrp/AsnC ligand binding domain-containing protein [Bacteroidia bacterium]NNE14308.1 winged helix-turn-helix transcriptional regulator [Saprospiraceae bacterium]NNL90844.1 winged helix-turn-helix transcriptional regulator [Saprospiraceae bacterium]